MRILIAEDERSIAAALKYALEKNKYSVDVVHNGLDALDYITAISYDAVVLDIMMPELDGLAVLKKAREAGCRVPALFLTAKGEVEDRVAGLDAGADDYLPKPFAMREFLARVRALTRRSATYSAAVLAVGNVTLNCNQYVLSVEQESTRLNNKEFQLMELFFKYPGHIFSSEHLLERIWGLDTETNIDAVWTYIGFLRRKLKQLGANIELKTIRGAGYSLEDLLC